MLRMLPVVVALAMAGALVTGSTPVEAGKTKKVTVGNNFFKPKKKTIKRGTKVRFRWTGGGLHNVTKRRGPGRQFQSRTTRSRGVNFKKRFRKRGTYKIFCTIHPNSMNLKLRVVR